MVLSPLGSALYTHIHTLLSWLNFIFGKTHMQTCMLIHHLQSSPLFPLAKTIFLMHSLSLSVRLVVCYILNLNLVYSFTWLLTTTTASYSTSSLPFTNFCRRCRCLRPRSLPCHIFSPFIDIYTNKWLFPPTKCPIILLETTKEFACSLLVLFQVRVKNNHPSPNHFTTMVATQKIC